MSIRHDTPSPHGSGQQARRGRDLWLTAALIGIVVASLVGIAAATGWEEISRQLSRIGLVEILILLGLSLGNYVLRGLRWHVFARRLSLPISLADNLLHFAGGFAMSVTPGRLGELVRTRWIHRQTGQSFDKTAPLILVDRASDLAAMAVLMAVALFFSASGISGAIPVALACIITAALLTRPALLRESANIAYRTTRRWPRVFARVRRSSRTLSRFTDGWTMLISGFLGLAGWFAEGCAFFLLLHWLGADVSLALAIAIFTFSTLAGGLTGAPGGLGGAEAAMVALLSVQHVPLEISVPATAIIRVTTLWFAILIGVAAFPMAEKHSLKVRNALEKN